MPRSGRRAKHQPRSANPCLNPRPRPRICEQMVYFRIAGSEYASDRFNGSFSGRSEDLKDWRRWPDRAELVRPPAYHRASSVPTCQLPAAATERSWQRTTWASRPCRYLPRTVTLPIAKARGFSGYPELQESVPGQCPGIYA